MCAESRKSSAAASSGETSGKRHQREPAAKEDGAAPTRRGRSGRGGGAGRSRARTASPATAATPSTSGSRLHADPSADGVIYPSRRRLFTRYIARSAAASSSSSFSPLQLVDRDDADARGDLDRDVACGDRHRTQRLGRLRRDLAGLPGRHVQDERRELVAAEPPDHIGRPQAPPQDVGRRPQHLVAREMARVVVHELEVVEIEEKQRAVLALCAPCAAARGAGRP